MIKNLVNILLSCLFLSTYSMANENQNSSIRVPAEWEIHEATWMQWPNDYDKAMRKAFSDTIEVIKDYEIVHILTSTKYEKNEAEKYLASQGVSSSNISWHIVPIDNSWLRDNGPIYVTNGEKTWIQNWGFDAWGGNFGDEVKYENDNQIPSYIGKYLNMKVYDYQDYILEKGNLEFNGKETLVLNWDCQDDRNPGIAKEEHERVLKKAFGVTKIIWAYGYHPEDGTTGHIDGSARFVDAHTLVIADVNSKTEKDLAIEAKGAGLDVKWYPGDPNWLVGNGFVVAMSSGDSEGDKELRRLLKSFFPNRDVHMVEASSIANAGGGIHCVTNDQPAF